MGFSDLKKQSSLGALTSKLVKEADKMNNKGGGADDRLWKPEMDKSGNGYAVIRFLPAPDGEDLPWVKLFSHAFQGPGGWYIENSLTTIGGKDPVGELNRELWNSGSEANKEIVRKQKRKLSFYANIYVVQDKANPHNEGKVFLYNPFDFWQGANFKLKLKKVAGYWNYDSSEFAAPSPLLDDDDAMEAIWKQEYSLNAFTADDQFKTYDELKKRLDYLLGTKPTRSNPVQEETEYDNYAATERKSVSEEEVMQKLEDSYKAAKEPSVTETPSVDDDDDPMSYFAKLADS